MIMIPLGTLSIMDIYTPVNPLLSICHTSVANVAPGSDKFTLLHHRSPIPGIRYPKDQPDQVSALGGAVFFGLWIQLEHYYHEQEGVRKRIERRLVVLYEQH